MLDSLLKEKIKNTVWTGRSGDVAMAQQLVDYITELSGHPPVISQGSLYTYNDQLGIWEDYNRDNIRQLIQLFDGTKARRLVIKKDNEGEDAEWRTLNLNHARILSVAHCVLRMCDYIQNDFFDHAPPGIAFTNGFVTVSRDGLLLVPHSPDHRAIHNVAVPFSPSMNIPQWLETLNKVFGRTPDRDNAIKALQQFAGACLVGQATRYTRALVLVGEGSNGKTTLQDVIKSLFPEAAVTYSNPHAWAGRFAIARLKGSLLNIAGELPNRVVAAADVFKTVLDGGAVDAEKKGQDHFSLYPRAGHFFSSNHIPQSEDSSTGFWRRLIILPCWYNFEDDPMKRPKDEVSAALRAERAGIITWALHGAVDLLRQGDYTIPECSTAIIADSQVDTDPVKSWLADNCETTDAEAWTSTEDLWHNFKGSSWAEGANVTKIGFAKRLVELGKQRKTNQHARLRGFMGVKIAKRNAFEQALIDYPVKNVDYEDHN